MKSFNNPLPQHSKLFSFFVNRLFEEILVILFLPKEHIDLFIPVMERVQKRIEKDGFQIADEKNKEKLKFPIFMPSKYTKRSASWKDDNGKEILIVFFTKDFYIENIETIFKEEFIGEKVEVSSQEKLEEMPVTQEETTIINEKELADLIIGEVDEEKNEKQDVPSGDDNYEMLEDEVFKILTPIIEEKPIIEQEPVVDQEQIIGSEPIIKEESVSNVEAEKEVIQKEEDQPTEYEPIKEPSPEEPVTVFMLDMFHDIAIKQGEKFEFDNRFKIDVRPIREFPMTKEKPRMVLSSDKADESIIFFNHMEKSKEVLLLTTVQRKVYEKDKEGKVVVPMHFGTKILLFDHKDESVPGLSIGLYVVKIIEE